MKLFSLLNHEDVTIEATDKIIPKEIFSKLLDIDELIEKAKLENENHRKKVEKEAEEKGFQEGLNKFSEQISLLEKEREKIKKEMQNLITPLALAAVKKILGREIEEHPETIVDIIATGLKSISHHAKVKIFVNKADVEIVERHKNRFRDVFDHLQTLNIAYREDVPEKGAIIETEAGILHVNLEQQINQLEKAFQEILQKEKR